MCPRQGQTPTSAKKADQAPLRLAWSSLHLRHRAGLADEQRVGSALQRVRLSLAGGHDDVGE